MDINLKVKDLVSDNGSWNWTIIRNYLPSFICSAIDNIKPPSIEDGQDHLVWNRTPSGRFSIKSTICLLKDTNAYVNSELWKLVWNIRCPELVRLFLWLVAHDRLPSKSLCKQRLVLDDDTCPNCLQETEDTIHALRDCRFAASIWKQLIPTNYIPYFFRLPLKDWLIKNLKALPDNSRNVINPWPVTFATTTWLLWKWRNALVFQEDFKPIINPMAKIRFTASDFWYSSLTLAKSSLAKGRQEDRWIRWIPPIPNWIKLNCDGSFNPNKGCAGSGGVFRDQTGSWVLGFT